MQTSLKPMADSNTPIAIQESATVLQVIQKAASDPSCDIEKLERLMAMHERMQAKQAEQQYAAAMAAMQQELPAIGERGNAAGRYTYALWEDINEKLKPILAKHGFSISFRMPRCEKGIEVEGVLTHRAGHSERTTIVLPADTSGNKNAVQAVASSVSYGKRYTAGALLNFTTHGEDDDAFTTAAPVVITEAQAKQLKSLLDKCSDKAQAAFSSIHGTPEQVTKDDFDRVLAMLKKSADQNQAG
ncbi:ERF family protein [Pseudomonas aeruginosa]|uniref:ERF family protein n=1 Tax=Pseudomonas aeruginosa TaxID=287 RepID=UPI002927C690|nr:ERF family protein [Pseudomonas aeruginosa]EKH5750305.1 ERF family protein [Pseudomonas aeruginosa]ELN4321933.1 ERF family protein [Pseudomonas aeruginosa]ELN4394743.1 ERF family protein [Pseudomonas aeruginosa]